MDDFLHALEAKKDVSAYSDIIAQAFGSGEILMASQNAKVQGFL